MLQNWDGKEEEIKKEKLHSLFIIGGIKCGTFQKLKNIKQV